MASAGGIGSTLYPTTLTNSSSIPLPRVDSPLEGLSSMSYPPAGTQGSDSGASVASSSPEALFDAPKGGRQRRSTSSSKGNPSLRFFIVDHPKKLKDKQQMTENRRHVMNDYLDKERRNPESTDARVNGSTATKKRKRLDVPYAPDRNAGPRQGSICSTQSTSSSNGSSDDRNYPLASEEDTPYAKKAQITPRHRIQFYDDIAPLVKGINGRLGNSQYLQTSLQDVPHPTSLVGSNLNPFDTWPTLSNPMCDIQALKWCCSKKFGSEGIAAHWVPLLLRAKHAFLSTICISASHEDIMRRGMQAPHERLQHGSHDRMQARCEVIALINQAMNDDQSRIADTTIVAVLQLLNSEIMGCDDQVMRIHQQGLHDMVRQRGGLEKLGVEGQLASILTITMYMISALRETAPHSDFYKYAAQRRTKPPHSSDLRAIPESPVYCRLSSYHTIHRSVTPFSPVYRLLEILRLLTNSFVRSAGPDSLSPLTPVEVTKPWEQGNNSILPLRDEVFSLRPADDRIQDFADTNGKHTYEALRLTAMLYSHALANRIPFSKAAKQLSTRYAATYPQQQNSNSSSSWHGLIKSQLQQTDISDCWSHMAGVLFWTTLVAGACANPDSASSELSTRDRWDENEEARKWLTAVAVRCSILLSFEYGGAILETLERIVGIEKVLAKGDGEIRARSRGRESNVRAETVRFGGSLDQKVSSSSSGARRKAVFGPMEGPFEQRTFQDFAQDFLSETF